MIQSNLATSDALYRLALLIYGDGQAAEAATWNVLQSGSSTVQSAQISQLAPALLGGRVRRWRYQPAPRLMARSGLDESDARELLDALGVLSPEQRLALGLWSLRSLSWSEAAALVTKGRKPADPRPRLGVVLGLVPAAGPEQPIACSRCIEAILRDEEGLGPGARQHLAGCDHCQEVRSGWQTLNERLRAALPALFVTPPEVLRRFSGPPPERSSSVRWRLPALLGVIVLLVALFILRSGGDGQRAAALGSSPLTAHEALARSLDRFNRVPAGGQVVHEVAEFDLQLPDGPGRISPDGVLEADERVTLERWYDYGPPARLRVELRRGDDLLYAIAANGEGQIQSLWEFSGRNNQSRSTVILPAGLDARYIPVLRQPYSNALIPGLFSQTTPFPFAALQAARANPAGVMALGSTSALGRPAWLISVEDDEQDYLLTIDQETYSVVDIQLVTSGGQQQAQHPWRVTLLEVLESAPSERFQLGSSSWGTRIEAPVSPFLWSIPFGFFDLHSPAEVPAEPAILLPEPDVISATLHTMFWSSGGAPGTTAVYWDEYSIVIISQEFLIRPGDDWPYEEAGIRFRIEDEDLYWLENGSLVVADPATLPGGEGPALVIQLIMPVSTAEEREVIARRILRTLAPADQQRLESFLNFGPLR